MKTYSAKPAEVEKKWVVIDGTGLVVGRLATIVAMPNPVETVKSLCFQVGNTGRQGLSPIVLDVAD